jgi:phage baseplate assembly protein W
MIKVTNLTSQKTEKNSVFSDIDFSFQEIKVSGNSRNNDYSAGNDLSIFTDEAAIKSSIRNLLFQTRHLSNAATNLKSYIGEQISEFRGLSLGQDIERTLSLYEPRIKVEKILVFTDLDKSQYRISLIVTIKNLGKVFNINAEFNRNGSFNFINN